MFWAIFITSLFLLISIGAFTALYQKRKIQNLSASLQKFKESFDEIDEQAKLIIKTDLELNRTQEELDKRLKGLDALQAISRLVSTSLDEREIFELLGEPLVSDMGLEQYFFLILNNQGSLNCAAHLGASEEESKRILAFIGNNLTLVDQLKNRQAISSINATDDERAFFLKHLKTRHFIITPIMAKNTMLGILLATSHSTTYAVTEGDEEIASILSDQIGQAIQNARLFEEVFHSRQKLELMVQERTRQLQEALSNVQQVSKMKSEFISAVSHELRTPLTSIKGYASLLSSGKLGNIPDAVRERLEKINHHSDSLVQLINNLLDISRIESGKTGMKRQRSSIASIIDNVQDLLAPQLKEKNVRLVLKVPPETPQLLVDQSQIERVFINLVGNAVKFTPSEGTITVTAEPRESDVLFSVADTGIGLKEDDRRKLFNEFYRVDNDINQSMKGSGLGLSLAKKIIEAHNGQIWVDSIYTKGSTFSFTIPHQDDQT